MSGLGDFEKTVQPMAAVMLANQARNGVVRKRGQLGLERPPHFLEDLAQFGSWRRRAQHESALRTARHEIQRDRRGERASYDPASQFFDSHSERIADGSAQRGDRIEPSERAELLARV